MCQQCVDDGEISQRTYDAIEAFLHEWPDAEFGPAHIVLSDSNIENGHITWCIGLARAALSRDPKDLRDGERDIAMMEQLHWYADQDRDELRATITFLEWLLTIPQDER